MGMTTRKMLENANKVAFLIESYPNHTMTQIIELLQMPAIDINAAIWYAQEVGFINEPDGETQIATIKNKPETWDFGSDVADLEDTLLYCFKELAKTERDLEENYLANWTAGHSAMNVMIALKHLENNRELVQYEIEDGENAYVFFTLYENSEQLWGRKQFKTDPMGEEAETTEAEE
jgi:hypothetical protein